MANSWRISALAERHRALGSKLEDWSGMGTAWTYASDLADEHEAIRTRAGLMDVSGLKKVHYVGPHAESLLVVEVITPSGNWSSYPPHKHERDALPEESLLEETYYHRIHPPQGYAVQRVYTDDRSLDETVLVEDRDVVLVPRGYHPVGAAHGYDLFYLNVMAGPVRSWKFTMAPDHAHLVYK